MQCKDINEQPILEFLLKHEGQWCNWYFGDDRDIRQVFPTNCPPKLLLAKMQKMGRKGLVDGCFCGCRGDYEITEKGKQELLHYKVKQAMENMFVFGECAVRVELVGEPPQEYLDVSVIDFGEMRTNLGELKND